MMHILLCNKPFGLICVHPVMDDYNALPDFYPARRLNTGSKGLLLLTFHEGKTVESGTWPQP
jgi:23S rRNA pseudouridine2457 synthase